MNLFESNGKDHHICHPTKALVGRLLRYRHMNRRAFLSTIVGATTLLSGCVQSAVRGNSGRPNTTSDSAAATDWTRSTDCSGMHDSIIRVERTLPRIADEYNPIVFSRLPSGERALARSIIENGGIGTCEPSSSFDGLVRRVSGHQRKQERMTVFIKRERTYYALYVEVEDMVISDQ